MITLSSRAVVLVPLPDDIETSATEIGDYKDGNGQVYPWVDSAVSSGRCRVRPEADLPVTLDLAHAAGLG
jgi:hypothetical protein